LNSFWLVAGMIASLILGKGIAAAIAGLAFGYARQARLTMWALTLPQVAATLVGYDTLNAAGERLLADEIFNTVLVLQVVTSLLGPILTELFTPGMMAWSDLETERSCAMPSARIELRFAALRKSVPGSAPRRRDSSVEEESTRKLVD
jgi:hypothetical protein